MERIYPTYGLLTGVCDLWQRVFEHLPSSVRFVEQNRSVTESNGI